MLQAHRRPVEPRPLLGRERQHGAGDKLWGWALREVQVSSLSRDWTQDAGPRSAAQHRAHSPGSEGRAMGVGGRAGAQVPRQAGRTGQRLQCTDACGAGRAELDPTRPRSQPVPARQELTAGGDRAERCATGPGWPGERSASGLHSAAGSRTTWRTRSYPRRWAVLPAGNLSTRERWPPCPRPEASPAPPGLRGAATQSGVRCQRGYPLRASLPPAQLQRPAPRCLPTSSPPYLDFPQNEILEARSPPGHLLSVAKPISKHWFSPGVSRVP